MGEKIKLIAGPCVVEDYKTTHKIASFLKDLTDELDIPFFFKASYDKANRTSINSFRGYIDSVAVLLQVKDELEIKITSDVHGVREVDKAARILDLVQIPAFLCRQTDLILAVARTGKPMNIKKGQFMAPADMRSVVEKVRSVGDNEVMLTERGTTFGYNNLVVDMRSIPIMRGTGCDVIFDATHSVQYPGGGISSGGDRNFAPTLAKAAVAAGADGVFIECHPDPDNALCDGPNSVYLDDMPKILEDLIKIHKCLN